MREIFLTHLGEVSYEGECRGDGGVHEEGEGAERDEDGDEDGVAGGLGKVLRQGHGLVRRRVAEEGLLRQVGATFGE